MTSDVELQRRALAIFRDVIDEPPELVQEKIASGAMGDPRLVAQVRQLLEMDRSNDLRTTGGSTPAILRSPEPVPDQVGPYRLLELIGEGGMGRVYKAERNDGAFDRTVAVKFIHTLSLSKALAVQFEAERQIMAKLKHPNITQLLDGGTQDGRAYLVMEYVDGVPFAFDPAASRRSQVQRFIRVCHAVAHAHNNLILHRDIKPDNVLIDSRGEPMLVDFGVATLIEAVSASGQMPGFEVAPMTPQYTAPECLSGGPASVASDVYSMGVLLFEILIGSRPYELRGTTLEEAHRIVSEGAPPGASSGDRDLDLILAGAMHSDPARRYPGALALAEDLERWLEHRPIQARRDDLLYVFSRFTRRHRPSVALGAIAALTIMGLLVSTLLALQESDRQRGLAENHAGTAESAAAFLTTTLASANPLYAGKRLTTIDEALTAAEEALQVDLQNETDLSAYVRAALAEIYAGRGDGSKAAQYASLVQADLEQRDHGRFEASIRALLAETFFRIGDLEAAVNAADQMIVRETRRTSPNWEKVAMVMSTRGEALVSLGEFERAIEQLHSLITLLEKRTLDLPELTARAHNGLANAYVTTRQLEQADLHSRESLRILETAGLLDSSNGLQAQVNRAGLLSLIGRPDDAEAQYLQSIERMQNRFGPSHPWVVWATTSLGVMYNSRGEPQRAVEVMEPLLADVESTLPNDDETSAYFKAKLGYALCQAQRPASGLSLLEESLAARKLIYPPGNWNIPDAEMAIGYCHMKLGQDAQARSVLLTAKSNFIEIYGQEYRSVGSIDQWLADMADDR